MCTGTAAFQANVSCAFLQSNQMSEFYLTTASFPIFAEAVSANHPSIRRLIVWYTALIKYSSQRTVPPDSWNRKWASLQSPRGPLQPVTCHVETSGSIGNIGNRQRQAITSHLHLEIRWDSPAEVYWRFGGMYCCHLQGPRENEVASRLFAPTGSLWVPS
jgi:hypothetical protein